MFEFKKYYLHGNKNYDIIYDFVIKNIISEQKNDNKLYISEAERDFLLKHRIYYYNNNFYIIQMNLIKMSKIKINLQEDILNFFEPYPNIIKCDENNIKLLKYYSAYLKAKNNYPEYFIENYTHTINYNNVENLEYIRKNLISGMNISQIPTYGGESCLTTSFWIFRGWDEDTAKEKVKEYQRENSKKMNKKYKDNPEKYLGCYNTQLEYYTKRGYSLEDAIKLRKERCTTFSKKKCIEKYGEELGLKKFNERQEKWQNTLKNKDNYIEILISRQNYKGFSGISQELFKEIDENISSLNVKTYFASKNHEYGIGIKNYGGVLYDFVIPELKYAVEFNGERFHPRKDKMDDFEWKNWYNPFNKDSADVAFEKDNKKINALIEKGFIVDIIWDSDYLNDKNEIINNITNKIFSIYEKKKNDSR